MRLIDAETLREEVLYDNTYDNHTVNYYLGLIDEAPTVGPELPIPEEIEAMKARVAQLEKERGKYKAHSDTISSLPSCNNCANVVDCFHRVKLGDYVRINCHLWRGTEDGE